jgi:prophage regulatory protein
MAIAVGSKKRPARRQIQTKVSNPEFAASLIFKGELLDRIGVAFPTIWRWMQDGKFPAGVQVGGRTAWYENEINEWLASRPRREYRKAGV